MKTLKKQRGLSFLSWLIILSMAGIMAITGLKLAPVYLEYYTIAKILEQLQTEPSLKDVPISEIAISFRKRLNISQVDLGRDDYKFSKVDGTSRYLIEVEYEVRRPLLGNLSIIASFKRSAEVGG